MAAETGGGLVAALGTPALEIGNIGAQTMQKASQYLAEKGLPKLSEYAAKTPGMLSEMAKSSIYGGTASMAERKPGETLGETGERTALGAGIGAVAPPVVAAGRTLMGPAIKTLESFFDPKTAVLRELSEKAPGAMGATKYQARLTPEEFERLQRAGEPVNIADVVGAPESLSAAAARFPGDPRVDQINRSLQDRINQNGGMVGKAVDTAYGRPIDAYVLREQADAAARATNAPLYNQAYAHPNAQNIWDESLGRALNTNEGKAALQWADNEARKSAVEAGRSAPRNPFVIDAQGNVTLTPGETGAPLEFLDCVKRGLNQVYTDQARERDPARFTTQNMIDDLTGKLKQAVPPYGDALSNAGKFIRGSNAFEAGTQFTNLLPTSGSMAPGELRAQLEKFSSVNRGAMTAGERDQFRLGVGSWIKENPTEAAAIFKGNSPESIQARNAMRFVLGDQTFRGIDQSLSVARTASMLQEIRANPGLLRRLGLGAGEASLLGGAGVVGGIELARQVPGIVQAAQQHPILTGISALAGVQALGSRMGATRRLDSLLDMASSSDPRMAQQAADTLAKIAAKDTRWEKALDKIENTLGVYLAQHQMGEPNVPGVGPIGYEERKVGRATGGRVTAEGLVAAAEKAKKAVNKTTEPLLEKDDTSVARALEVANRHIEG
jgi:hypothetical protein